LQVSWQQDQQDRHLKQTDHLWATYLDDSEAVWLSPDLSEVTEPCCGIDVLRLFEGTSPLSTSEKDELCVSLVSDEC
jgi:hypothetical protein